MWWRFPVDRLHLEPAVGRNSLRNWPGSKCRRYSRSRVLSAGFVRWLGGLLLHLRCQFADGRQTLGWMVLPERFSDHAHHMHDRYTGPVTTVQCQNSVTYILSLGILSVLIYSECSKYVHRPPASSNSSIEIHYYHAFSMAQEISWRSSCGTGR